MTDDRPNILLIQADQLVATVLPGYGGSADTPRLDEICGQGVVFENAYTNYPLCAPSRFSMLTGLLASRIDAFDNAAELPAAVPTIAHYLRLAGYQTCLSGKMHFVGPDMLHGFEERLATEIYPTDFLWTPNWDEDRPRFTSDTRGVLDAGVHTRTVQIDYDEAVAYRTEAKLHDLARSSDRRPFLLVASFTHPHEPYYCQREHWDRYRHEDIPMPRVPVLEGDEQDAHSIRLLKQYALLDPSISEAHVRTARHAYYGSVSYFDDQVGRVVRALASTGLDRNTMIVVTSDHGDMLGERGLWYKKHFFEPAMRVPLVFHAPQRFDAARVRENVSLVDLAPTLIDVAGVADAGRVAPPEPFDGRSLLRCLASAGASLSDTVLAEVTCEGTPAPMFMVKRGPYKLVTGGGAPDRLYDLAADPEERDNLAGRPEVAEPEGSLAAKARHQWDTEAITARIRLSQRRRLLVQAAHGRGLAPSWDYIATDPSEPAGYRGEGSYNEWAWSGLGAADS